MADAIYCNTCGTQNRSEARFCSHCGHSLVPAAAAAASPASPPLETPADAAPTMELTAFTPPALSPTIDSTARVPPAAAWPVAAVRYGGFWIRFLAFIIDGFILGVVLFPFSLLLRAFITVAGSAVKMPGQGIRMLDLMVTLAFGVFCRWLYEALLESSSRQATLGKAVLGLKVTDLAGERISFARATGRHFAKFISSMIFCIGYFMIGFTERKQGLHDMIAGTLVSHR